MSERPTPVTRSDEILCAVLDELVGLRQDLADRGRAPVVTIKAPASAPATPEPAKKTAGKKTRIVTGR